jgi:Tol biopolymer transport system component
VLLAAVGVAYHFWTASRAPAGPAKIAQISHWDKPMYGAVISPDGHTVAFSGEAGGAAQVFVMLTSGGDPLQLTNDDGDKDIDSFSPDGTQIYYSRTRSVDEEWAVPTLGGTPTRIAAGINLVPSADGSSVFYLKGENFGIFRADKSGLNEQQVFSMDATKLKPRRILPYPDGKRLLVLTHDAVSLLPVEHAYTVDLSKRTSVDEEWAVPTLGGTPTRIAAGINLVPSADGSSVFYLKGENFGIFRADKSGLNEQQVFSMDATKLKPRRILPYPDGKRLLVLTHDAVSLLPVEHAYTVDLSTRTSVDLGNLQAESGRVSWAEPGKSVLVARTTGGITNIWKYDLDDKTSTQLTFGIGPDSSPMNDPEGKGVYFVSGKFAGVLTAYNVASKQSTNIASENATQPAISPDRTKVMYVTNPSRDHTEVWVSGIDGSNPVKIASGASLATTSWAPDNAHLVFVSSEPGKPDAPYMVVADGSGLRPISGTGGNLFTVFWSPDQKSIYVTGFENGSSIPGTWKEDANGANPQKIVSGCGNGIDVSRDGNYILGPVWTGEKRGIYEYSVADNKCTLLVPGAETFAAVFTPDGKAFEYATPSQHAIKIYRVPWSAGKVTGPQQVALALPFAFPLSYGGNAYDFSRDLSTVVFARPGGQADLYLISQK